MARCVPYVALERHGLIGDRRTAALVAADGTLDWLCLPDYDDQIVFGALVDAERGGFWRMGPARLALGEQAYVRDSFSLVTVWRTPEYELELGDTMAWPENERPSQLEGAHAVLRRLRCTRGEVLCTCDLSPTLDFEPLPSLRAPALVSPLNVWSSRPLPRDGARVHGDFVLARGDELWVVLATDSETTWSAERAIETARASEKYWRHWRRQLAYAGPHAREVIESAAVVHVLGHARTGSLVAAPTTSLPERIGGDWNADYRFAWVRDASISLAWLTHLGDTRQAARYMDWLAKLDVPLQPVYRIDGERHLEQRERKDLHGYRGSKPVRLGNQAVDQLQVGAAGFLIDCAREFIEHGGQWRPEYWQLVRRIADETARRWQEPDNGIWELPQRQHYISSRVMCWVGLDRAIQIAERVGEREPIARWQQEREKLRAYVATEGWSDRLGAFRQRAEAHNLDSSLLLVPIMRMWPADDRRVHQTIERIVDELAVDTFVFRFVPSEVPGIQPLPLGEYEGAFLPCTFWLATALAMAGRTDEAERIVAAAERVAGPLGLFSEGVDVRTREPLGNMPLMFSHVEYIRAVFALSHARLLQRARRLVRRAEQRLRGVLHR